MQDISGQNFGYLIAYLLPGLIVLWPLEEYSPLLRVWLGTGPEANATIGGFLYATIAAIGTGLLASTVRWAVIDAIHHATGIAAPKLRFGNLATRVAAFEYLIEIHYRYYQFYGNSVVALATAYVALRNSGNAPRWGGFDAGFLAVEVLLFVGSRDALRKYYRRAHELLSSRSD